MYKRQEYVLGKRDVPIIPDKRIQEIDFGVLEGDQVRDADGNYIDPQIETFFRAPVNFKRPEKGEDIFDVIARTKDFCCLLYTSWRGLQYHAYKHTERYAGIPFHKL